MPSRGRRLSAANAQVGGVLTVVASSGAADAGSHGDRVGRIDSLDAVENAVRNLVKVVRRQRPESSSAASGAILDLQVDDVRCRLEAASSADAALAGGPLSPRETEVALMVAQGHPNKTIAAVLEISSFTVSSYLRRIFAKLGVNTRAAMVARALENRMLPAPVTPVDKEPDPVR